MSDTPPIFPPPTFPLEIAEHVIDCVGSGHQAYRTLMTCALTCKAWLPRSRARLYSAVVIRRQFQLIQFSRSLAYRPLLSPLVKEFIVLWKRGWQKSTLQCLISFPDQLACRLPNLRQLKIFSTLTASPLSFYGPHFFLSIGEFRSMTTLVLSTIVFQSFSNFGRLLLALPTITSLDCYRLQWKRLGADPFRFRRRDEPMSLRSLVVCLRLLAMCSLADYPPSALYHCVLSIGGRHGNNGFESITIRQRSKSPNVTSRLRSRTRLYVDWCGVISIATTSQSLKFQRRYG